MIPIILNGKDYEIAETLGRLKRYDYFYTDAYGNIDIYEGPFIINGKTCEYLVSYFYDIGRIVRLYDDLREALDFVSSCKSWD